MFNRFAEANPRIEDYLFAANTLFDGETGTGFQPLGHFLDNIVISRSLLHRFRRALHMHEDHLGTLRIHH